MTIKFATVCSGVEAVSLAWKPLGFEAVFYADYDPDNSFPTRFLRERFPTVPNLGDMLKIDGSAYAGKVDVLWGSTPCQAFSLAGDREGISDPRGALTPALVGLADAIQPQVLCWENVPGVLTDKDNAFGIFLAALVGSDSVLVPPGKHWKRNGFVVGPHRRVAWRSLNAQHFGLAQCRERVFLVGCPSDGGPDPRDVLFEPLAPRDAAFLGGRRRTAVEPGAPGCASAYGAAIRGRKGGAQLEIGGDLAHCLRASQGGGDKEFVLYHAQPEGWRVRRITAVEAERLMGMPDNWTLIEGASDGQRYHAVGNSLAVPCVRFIGERIKMLLEPQA